MKKQIITSLRTYFRAPLKLLKGNADGATVTKALAVIVAGGVALSLLVLLAVKVFAAANASDNACDAAYNGLGTTTA